MEKESTLITKDGKGKDIIIPESESDEGYIEEGFDFMANNPRKLCWILEVKCDKIDECYKRLLRIPNIPRSLPGFVFSEFSGDCKNIKILATWMQVPQPFSERLTELIKILKEEETKQKRTP